jgi:hypothetical protein
MTKIDISVDDRDYENNNITNETIRDMLNMCTNQNIMSLSR